MLKCIAVEALILGYLGALKKSNKNFLLIQKKILLVPKGLILISVTSCLSTVCFWDRHSDWSTAVHSSVLGLAPVIPGTEEGCVSL